MNWQVMDTSTEVRKSLGGATALLLHKTFVDDAKSPEGLFVALGVTL